jgi:vancomycin resistance protein VanW
MSDPRTTTVESGCGRDRMEALATRHLRFSERHPWAYPLAVTIHRTRRRIHWIMSTTPWATRHTHDDLPVRVKVHKSLLLRQLGESEMYLQHNKVTNLTLAASRVDGLLIAPGETFSFNRVVGNCTRRRGYLDGMKLSNGEAAAGVGGGICQLANLLHWMVLHSELTVTDRSEHSFDPFPDNGRVLPWGTGCSIVYNYVDLQFRNDTDRTYQLKVAVGERYLEGRLRADRPERHSYRVFARDERFYRLGDDYFRSNEIWRTVIDRRTGDHLDDEPIRRNCALVKYLPTGVDITVIDGERGMALVDPWRTGAVGPDRLPAV